MKNVSVLIPEGDFSLVNVEGIHHIFAEVNKIYQREGKETPFHFQLIGKQKDNFLKEDFFSVHPRFLIDEEVKTDLLIIPALHGDIRKSLMMNQDLVPWIIEQYRKGAEIVSLCTGAFLLASTGLLSGRSCATHWIHANDFREMFPDVNLVADQIITDEKGIYTSGAAYTFLNLILYVLEKYVDRDTVIFIAKVFAIDRARLDQSQFMIFQGYKRHSDSDVLKAQEFIEKNYSRKITVEQLAEHVSLGRRNFERRFKAATTHSVMEYIQRVKVEAAKKQFEVGKKVVNEVIYNVGYNDSKAFRNAFKKIVGMSPMDYRNKYCKELEMN